MKNLTADDISEIVANVKGLDDGPDDGSYTTEPITLDELFKLRPDIPRDVDPAVLWDNFWEARCHVCGPKLFGYRSDAEYHDAHLGTTQDGSVVDIHDHNFTLVKRVLDRRVA